MAPMMVSKETQQSDVDARWLAEAGARMGVSGTPRFPLVVGGSGMTGSNLCVLLANTPGVERIRVLDRVPIRKEVLADCMELQMKLNFVQHRLGIDRKSLVDGSREELHRAFEGIDCVFSAITPDVQKGSKEEFYKTNVVGCKLLLEAAIAKNVPRFVYLSSIAVTSHFEHSHDQKESDGLPALDDYISPYDRSKRMGEDMVLEANGKNGLATLSLRAGGILMSPRDYAFRNFFMIPGMMMTISGCAYVDFIDARDVVRGMLLGAQALHNRADARGEAFFLTKGEGICTTDMIVTTGEFMGWPSLCLPDILFEVGCLGQNIFHQVRKALGFKLPGIPPHWFWKMSRINQTFDNSKARDILGYAPEVSHRQSIQHVCECHARDIEGAWIRPMPWLVHLVDPRFLITLAVFTCLVTYFRWTR